MSNVTAYIDKKIDEIEPEISPDKKEILKDIQAKLDKIKPKPMNTVESVNDEVERRLK